MPANRSSAKRVAPESTETEQNNKCSRRNQPVVNFESSEYLACVFLNFPHRTSSELSVVESVSADAE